MVLAVRKPETNHNKNLQNPENPENCEKLNVCTPPAPHTCMFAHLSVSKKAPASQTVVRPEEGCRFSEDLAA